jgi:ABC-2 type transport system ATP-binding protein
MAGGHRPEFPFMASPSPAASIQLLTSLGLPAILQVENLSKRFGSFWALRGASFSVRPGEILGLIGPNGSGKTTLFECLAGVTPSTLGTVSVRDHVVSPHERKRHLYFVPDGIRPWPDQTVDWAVRFIAGLHGAPANQRDGVIESLALEPLLGARVGDLSKGEHRRVLLAVGLLTPQPLLMLDEPFDGLDLRQTRDVMDVLRRHVAGGRTLFLSIHQLGDAARICDRLVLLSGGHVVGAGTLPELRATAGTKDGGLEEVFLALT